MKRFLLFAGQHYYPGRAWNDFRGCFDTAEEAMAAGRQQFQKDFPEDWLQIIDGEKLTIVEEETRRLSC